MPSKVTKWLASYKPASAEAVEELITWMYASAKLLEDMEDLFEKMTSTLIGEVCQRFVLFYGSSLLSLRHFVVFLLPSLVHAYLSHLNDEDTIQLRKANVTGADNLQNIGIANFNALENCLLQICRHFMTRSSSSCSPISTKFDPRMRLPNLSESSIYHDGIPVTDSPKDENDIFPMQSLSLNVCNRVTVISQLIRSYLETLAEVDLLDPNKSLLAIHSVDKYCHLCERVASVSKHPRLPSSSSMLCELLLGLDMILYRLDEIDHRTDKIRRTTLTLRTSIWSAISEIEKRATYSCLSAPLLLAEAALHSRRAQYGSRAVTAFHIPTSSSPCVDVSSLIAIADEQKPLPTTQLTDVSESDKVLHAIRSHHSSGLEVITNASFRPELVPEDITVSDRHSRNSSQDRNFNNSMENRLSKTSSESKLCTVDNRVRVNPHNKQLQSKIANKETK